MAVIAAMIAWPMRPSLDGFMATWRSKARRPRRRPSVEQRPARCVPDREHLDRARLHAVKEAIGEIDECRDSNAGSLFDFGGAERKLDDTRLYRRQSRLKARAHRRPMKPLVIFNRLEVGECGRRPSDDHSSRNF